MSTSPNDGVHQSKRHVDKGASSDRRVLHGVLVDGLRSSREILRRKRTHYRPKVPSRFPVRCLTCQRTRTLKRRPTRVRRKSSRPRCAKSLEVAPRSHSIETFRIWFKTYPCWKEELKAAALVEDSNRRLLRLHARSKVNSITNFCLKIMFIIEKLILTLWPP